MNETLHRNGATDVGTPHRIGNQGKPLDPRFLHIGGSIDVFVLHLPTWRPRLQGADNRVLDRLSHGEINASHQDGKYCLDASDVMSPGGQCRKSSWLLGQMMAQR